MHINPLLQRRALIQLSTSHPSPSGISFSKFLFFYKTGLIRSNLFYFNWNSSSSPAKRNEECVSPLAWCYPVVRGISKKSLDFHLKLRAAGQSTVQKEAKPPPRQDHKAVLRSGVSVCFSRYEWHGLISFASRCQHHIGGHSTTIEGNKVFHKLQSHWWKPAKRGNLASDLAFVFA